MLSNQKEVIFFIIAALSVLFKCTNHSNKRPFVSTGNEALIGTLMTIDDVNDIFPVRQVHFRITNGVGTVVSFVAV